MQIKNKELAFLSLCGDWDYRKNVDMTEPHLQGIAIRDNKILISCEKFSNTADDYVSCIATEIEDKNMINKFKKLNLKNKGEVIDFISNMEKIVDWKKISKMLEQEELKLCEEGLTIIESKSLEGWHWYKYDDGSGHLESPNKEEYMSYDLSTNEYRITKESDWELFPLSYYYADGVEPEKFDPFKFMEQEMLDYNLQKSKNEEFVL